MRSLLLNNGGDGSFGTTGASFLVGMMGVGGSTVIVVLMLGMGILTAATVAKSFLGGLTGSLRFGVSGWGWETTGCIGIGGSVVSGSGSWVGALISSIGAGVTAVSIGIGSAEAMFPITGTEAATTGNVSGVTGSSGTFSFCISELLSGGGRSLCKLLRLRPFATLDDRLRRFRASYWSK